MCVQFQIVFVGLSEVSASRVSSQTVCNRLYHDITDPQAPHAHTDPAQSPGQMPSSGGGIPV